MGAPREPICPQARIGGLVDEDVGALDVRHAQARVTRVGEYDELACGRRLAVVSWRERRPIRKYDGIPHLEVGEHVKGDAMPPEDRVNTLRVQLPGTARFLDDPTNSGYRMLDLYCFHRDWHGRTLDAPLGEACLRWRDVPDTIRVRPEVGTVHLAAQLMAHLHRRTALRERAQPMQLVDLEPQLAEGHVAVPEHC